MSTPFLLQGANATVPSALASRDDGDDGYASSEESNGDSGRGEPPSPPPDLSRSAVPCYALYMWLRVHTGVT